MVRAQILSVKDQEFVEAARAVGAGDLHIILFHILPNCLAPMIVQATIGVATAILDAAGLSFIGLGNPAADPPTGAACCRPAGSISGITGILLHFRGS